MTLRKGRACILSVCLVCSLSPAYVSGEPGDTGSDSVIKLLLHAQVQYQNLDFEGSKVTLDKAYQRRDELSGEELSKLEKYLGRIDYALEEQRLTRAAFSTGNTAFENGKWKKAGRMLSRVVESPYIAEDVRKEAQSRLERIGREAAGTTVAKPEENAEDKPMPVLAAPVAEDPEDAAAVKTDVAKTDLPEVKEIGTLEEGVESAQENTAATTGAVGVELAQAENDATTGGGTQDTGEAESNAGDAAPANDGDQTAADPPAAGGRETEPADGDQKDILVEVLIAEGENLIKNNRPEEAVDKFKRALKLAPDNAQARRKLMVARQLVAGGEGGGMLLELSNQLKVLRQIAESDIQHNMDRALSTMDNPQSAEDYEMARQSVKMAQNILRNNKRVFSEMEYRKKLSELQDRMDWIDAEAEKFNKKKVKEMMEGIRKEEEQRAVREQREREEKIAELTRRAKELCELTRWRESLSVLQEIVALDPSNAWATDNIYMLKQFIQAQSHKDVENELRTQTNFQNISTKSSEIPWYQLIRWPKDWKEISTRADRFGAETGAESEEDRAVRRKLADHIPVQLLDVTFADAIEYIRTTSGVSIYVNWGAIESELPDAKSAAINVSLADVTVEKALDFILDDAGGGVVELGYIIEGGVIRITTQTKLSQKVIPLVYDVRDLLFRKANTTGPRIDIQSIGQGSSGGGSMYGGGMGGMGGMGGGLGGGLGGGGGGLFEDEGGEEDAEEMTEEEKIQQLEDLIKQNVGGQMAWVDGGGRGQISYLDGNFVISQTAANHRQVASILQKLREALTISISIESRFITVSTQYLNQIGVNVDVFFNMGSQINGPSTVNPLTGGAFAGGPAGRIIDPYTGGSVPMINNSTWTQAGSGYKPSVKNLSPVGLMNNSDGFANLIGTSTVVPTSIGEIVSSPAMTLMGTFLDDVQVDFLISATKADNRTRELAAPRITLMNGQRSYVSVATQQAFIASIEPVVSENTTALRPIVEYAPTGTMLDVAAWVSHDRRYVKMMLRPQVIELLSLTFSPISSGGSEAVIGLPEIKLHQVETAVSVPDGGTVLLGGQKLAGEITREMGVPILSDVPVLNRAFTNRGKLRDEQTLLILVKPTILIQEDLETKPELQTEENLYGKFRW